MEYELLKEDFRIVIEKAENLAIDNIRRNLQVEPFIVFGEDSNKVKRIKANTIDDAIEIAETEISEIYDSQIVVLAFKDQIDLADGTFDAIITQTYGMDEDAGYSYGFVYKIVDNKIQFLNKRVFLGEVRNLLMF